MIFRIFSLNAWNAENDRELRTKNLIKSILDMKIDVLCMQEVDEKWETDMVSELDGYSFQRSGQLMVCSRYPIKSHKVILVNNVPMQLVHILGDYGGDERDIAIVNVYLPTNVASDHIELMMRKLNRIKHNEVVITGNFNKTTVDEPTGWEMAGSEPTWPSWKSQQPPKKLSWIFAKLSNYVLDSAPVIRGLYVSSHLPVLIKLNIP